MHAICLDVRKDKSTPYLPHALPSVLTVFAMRGYTDKAGRPLTLNSAFLQLAEFYCSFPESFTNDASDMAEIDTFPLCAHCKTYQAMEQTGRHQIHAGVPRHGNKDADSLQSLPPNDQYSNRKKRYESSLNREDMSSCQMPFDELSMIHLFDSLCFTDCKGEPLTASNDFHQLIAFYSLHFMNKAQ